MPEPASPQTDQKTVYFTLAADSGWRQRIQLALADLGEGARFFRLIWALALSDIKQRYRGSTLGPFWLTISMGVQIGAMAFLYADLFHLQLRSYLPYLTASMILWNYLTALVLEGSGCFIASETLIKGNRIPFLVHAARCVVRNTIVMAHNAVILLIVLVLTRAHLSFSLVQSVFGLLLWMVDAVALSLFLGAVCARFRDIPPIISAVMQIAFFLTPILWQVDILKSHSVAMELVKFNPFVYLLDIVRDPLLGKGFDLVQVLAALCISIMVVVVSFFGFARCRGRIAFWV